MVPVSAAESDGYRVTGAVAGGGLNVTVSVFGAPAFSGRLALGYDTSKLSLPGGSGFGALTSENGTEFIRDHAELSDLMDAKRGHVGFAWYGYGAQNDAIASWRFRFVDGATEADLDSTSIWLRYVPESGFGSWTAPASLQLKPGEYNTYPYAYLSSTVSPMDVLFDYPGSDREPESGAVTVRCRDVAGRPVQASLELNGRVYTASADGSLKLHLPAGESFNYRAAASGFGPLSGRLEAKDADLTFVNDDALVAQAAQSLEIGFYETDTAEAVTETLSLIPRTDTGVDVAWASSAPAIVTNSGLVFRPEGQDARVTRTATLTHGAAKTQKVFQITVLAKPSTVVPGVAPSVPGTSGGSPAEPSATNGRFSDLAPVPWAADAIEKLAEAGIIHGTGVHRFSPTQRIKRGDFLLLLMRMMAPENVASGREFADVPADSYYHDAILQARALGIATGTGSNRFSPESPITRQEMAVLTARAVRASKYLTGEPQSGDLGAFRDAAKIAPWAESDLSDMVGRGYLAGSNGSINPEGTATRAETAVFLCRIYEAHQ